MNDEQRAMQGLILQNAALMSVMLDWRERWDRRRPSEEKALRLEWEQLKVAAHREMAMLGKIEDTGVVPVEKSQ